MSTTNHLPQQQDAVSRGTARPPGDVDGSRANVTPTKSNSSALDFVGNAQESQHQEQQQGTRRQQQEPEQRARSIHTVQQKGGLFEGGGRAASDIGHMMREEQHKRDLESRVGKRPRVEGRGSSAAQRAAASEACKGITLEALQAQFYRPLSDVAKDLRVSVARLLKKCREFGILRWPYRHVRSVQESIEQLEKDREAAVDQVATDEMDLRLNLLRRRGELVVHFASCGLEADMRKGIFLADPRDVDAMLATAHGRQIPPPGWDSLGRFPDLPARDHFLGLMRAHMNGGGTVLTPPDSPHDSARVHADSASSLEDGRDMSHPHSQWYQPDQQAHRGGPQIRRSQGPWQHHEAQHHAQQPYQQQQPWQVNQLYARGLHAERMHPAYTNPYWSGGGGAVGISDSIGGAGVGGGGGGGIGGSSSRGFASNDFGRVRSPGRAEQHAMPAPNSFGYGASTPTMGPWPMTQQQMPPSAATGTAVVGVTHQYDAGGAALLPSSSKSNPVSPALRPIYPGPPGSSYHSVRPPGDTMRGIDQRTGHMTNAWAGESTELRGVGGGSGGGGGSGAGHGGIHRDMWRPPERLNSPPQSTPHHGLNPSRRPWGPGDSTNLSGRTGGASEGGGGGGAPGGGALPSIFEMNGGLERPPVGGFFPGAGMPAAAGAGGAAPESVHQAMGVDGSAGGGVQDPSVARHGHRGWGGMPEQQQQQQQQLLERPVSAGRWQDGSLPGRGEAVAGAVEGVADSGPLSGGSQRAAGGNAPWGVTGAVSQASVPGGGFDRGYGDKTHGGTHQGNVGADGAGGNADQSSQRGVRKVAEPSENLSGKKSSISPFF